MMISMTLALSSLGTAGWALSRLQHMACPFRAHLHLPEEPLTCRMCPSPVIEDEPHVLLHCPALQPLRDLIADLSFDGSIRNFMASGHPSYVGTYVSLAI